MANLKVTDLGSIPVVTLTDLIHVVDVSDTSGSPQGTSTKATIQQLQAVIHTTETFVALSDTPANYTGSAGKVVQVNAGGTALEFATSSGASIYTSSDTIGTGRVATLTDTLAFTGGEVTITGANDASGSKALVIKNDSGDDILRLENDREIFLGTAAANRIRSGSGGGGRMIGGVGNSAATPAFGFYSSNGIDDGAGGNGWYRPVTANTQAWTTASTERMRLSSGGNLSIGTTVASARLHVKGVGATNATSALKVENSAASTLLQLNDDGTFLLGAGAAINNNTCIAIGNNAKATQISSVAIGKDAGNTATSQYSVAIGHSAQTGLFGVSIGNFATLNAKHRATAVGRSANVTSNSGTALGYAASAGLNSVAVGANTQSSGQNAVGVGNDADATANGTVALGSGIKTSAAYSVILGGVAYAQTRTNTDSNTFAVYLQDADPIIKIHANNDSWINSTGSLGLGTITPDASALLDVNSTTKGFLPPRMTTAQRAAISSPAKGLIIYNTTTDQWEGNAGTPAAPNWVILG